MKKIDHKKKFDQRKKELVKLFQLSYDSSMTFPSRSLSSVHLSKFFLHCFSIL